MSIKQSRWQFVGISIFLIALTWAVFAQTGGYQFVNYDDPLYVLDNAHVRAGLTWRGAITYSGADVADSTTSTPG